MLHVPHLSASFSVFDNWGANPSATPGTSVVPGASSAEGSWTQVATSGNISQNIYGIYVQVHGGATAATAKLHVMDIGVDPAGGTSYTAVISDILCGDSPPLTAPGQREFFFPLFIPSGSAVAVRISGNQATAGTVFAMVRFYGYRSRPEAMPTGHFSETLGVTGTSGVTVTPGNAADGSWATLGTTTKELWWWQPAYQINNGTITAEYTYLEYAFGDGSNKHTIFKLMHIGTTGETAGFGVNQHMHPYASYVPLPAGATLYCRGRCVNAPDTGYQAAIIGIGG
jgi:hypothetical protein